MIWLANNFDLIYGYSSEGDFGYKIIPSVLAKNNEYWQKKEKIRE